MQRVILATDSNEPSGVGEHILTLGSELAPGHDVTVAAPDHDAGRSLLARAAVLGLAVKVLDLGQSAATRTWLGTHPDAILHVHAGIGWEGHDLVRYGKAAGLAVVRTEHLPYLLTSPVQQAAYRAMLKSVDGQIFVSRAVQESHRDQGNRLAAIVLNGIRLRPAQACQAQTRKALGLSGTAPVLMTVARFSPQKGHTVLVSAAPAILKKFPDAKFVLVGTGPDFDAVRDSIESQSLWNSFILLGQRDDIPDLLAAADLFVLPSLFEGLPLALLEAMAAHLPAVVSAADGSVDAIGNDHLFLATPGEPAALANAVIAALDDPASAMSAAKAASERFTQRFSADRMAAGTAAFYQKILQQRDAEGRNQ